MPTALPHCTSKIYMTMCQNHAKNYMLLIFNYLQFYSRAKNIPNPDVIPILGMHMRSPAIVRCIWFSTTAPHRSPDSIPGVYIGEPERPG